MNVYIWYQLDYVTQRFHPEAGVMIVATRLATARELFRKEEGIHEKCDIYTAEPDEIIMGCDPETKPHVIIFPDAGCC